MKRVSRHHGGHWPTDAQDDGFTLVELIVYSALSLIVLAIIGGLFFQTFNVQSRVGTSTASTTNGQQALSTIAKTVRNSTSVTVTSSPSGSLIVTKTTNSAGTVTCGYKAYYFAYAGSGTIYYKSSTSVIAEPAAAALPSWKKILSGVTKPATQAPFTAVSTAVTMHFFVKVGITSPVELNSTVVSRATYLEASQC